MSNMGAYGEELAYRYLVNRGLLLRQRNFRTRYGEIDLIMQDDQVIVFVEVKYRSSIRFGSPLEAVNLSKQRQIKKIARIYLTQLGCEPQCRFDVIGILGKQIKWVKGAFT